MIKIRTLPFLHRRPRRGLTQPVAPLNLLSATTYDPGGGNFGLTLVLDSTLEDPISEALVSTANPAQWSAIYEGSTWVGIAITKDAYNTLNLVLSLDGDHFGSEVKYNADPSDIGTENGRMLEAISGFPLE